MSIFNDLDEIVTYGKDMFCSRIIDGLSVITIDSSTAANHESTLGNGTNDLGNDTGSYAKLYSDQVEQAFGLFGNSTDTGNITANINGSNCYHKSCVKDE